MAAVWALLTGPNTHLHDQRNRSSALIHSHSFEAHHASAQTQLGSADDHAKAKYLDLFSGLTTPSLDQPALVAEAVPLSQPALAGRSVEAELPTAHAPPALSSRLLRSPPA